MAQFIEVTGEVLNYKITSLENTQKAIGGWLETLHLGGNEFLVFDEEGKLKGLPRNPKATIMASKVLGYQDYIAGPAILTTREEFENHSPDEDENNNDLVIETQKEYLEDFKLEQASVVKETKKWTKDEIKEKIKTDVQWLERAIVAIYDKQTEDEKRIKHTAVTNGVGFNGPDSNKMSYLAQWIKSGKHLSGDFVVEACERMQKYAAQLTRIANKEI